MSGWSIDLDKYAAKTIEKTERVLRKTALEIFKRIIMRTPVGNPAIWQVARKPKGYVGGRLRNNWFVSIGAESSQTTEYTAPTGGATVNRATGAAQAWKPSGGQSIFMTNNLPYAETIERGRVDGSGSIQAPYGMVKITVAEFDGIVNRSVNEEGGA